MKNKRDLIYAKTCGYCWYCGRSLNKKNTTTDHVIPRCNGGDNHISNLVPCCKSCNSSKGSRSLDDYRLWLSVDDVLRVELGLSARQIKRLIEHGISIPLVEHKFYFERVIMADEYK